MLKGQPAPAPPALLRCLAGGLPLCLDLADVARIERSDRLSPGPGGEEPLGFLPAPGGRVPVWSLAGRLGLGEPSRRALSPVIVVRSSGRLWGLAVERLARAAVKGERQSEIAVSPLPPLAGDSRRGWFRGVVQLADGLALYLDPERLHPDAGPAYEETAAPAGPPDAPVPGAATAPPGLPPAAARAPRRARPEAGRLVVFSTSPGGGSPLSFALALSQVLEIARPQPLLRVPGSGDALLGIARLRGEALPVVDLQLRLGAGPSFFEGASRLLVARGSRSPQALCFPVRPDVRLLSVPQEGRAVPASGVDGSLLRGAFETEGGTLLVPDLDRLLTRR